MEHCTDCYGTNTILPCANVGCIDVNYSKCILYSGDNLYCALGALGAVSFTGTANVPGTTSKVTVSGTNLSGVGAGATFEVTRTAGSNQYTVVIANKGSAYAVGDQIKILGTSLDGLTPANDLVITVTELAAVIPNGALLDDIIETFHNALCNSSTGGGLDYSALSYSCLRQNGALTGLGPAITTETQFVQSASAALCALNTTLNAYDTSVNLTSFLNVGSLPGVVAPYTLNEVLGGVATAITNINTNLNYAPILSNPCVSYAFTSKPSTSAVADYFNWITANMCGMYTSLDSDITTVTNLANSLKTYIAGSGSVPANVNTSSLPGGSTTSTASAALSLLVSQVAGINGTLATVPSGSYSLTWASCFGGVYPANSVFKDQTWSYTNTTATLQTQLDRIVSVLSKLNIKFNSTYFTVDSTSTCGATISLQPGVAFTPASLNSAILNDLGDVTVASVANGQSLIYDGGFWMNKTVTVKINNSTAAVTKTVNPTEIIYDLTINDTTPVIYTLSANNTTEYTVGNSSRFPLGSQPFPYAVKHGDIVTLHGVLQMTPTIAGLGWSHLTDRVIATLPSVVRPTNPIYFSAELYVKVGSSYSNVYTRATGKIDSSGNLTLMLMNPAGTLTLTNADLIEVVIGGASYVL